MRLNDPGATLAAAQLAIARQYGFASWRRLLGYVTALRDRGDQLRQAVHGGDITTAAAILDDHPDLVNATMDITSRHRRPSDTVVMSLLHVAIAANQIEMVRLPLRRGADPNCQDEDGNAPIHKALMSRLVKDPTRFVEVLLAFGADPALRNNKGHTPLDLALAEIGSIAEEYFPPMPRGSKNLEPAITLLQKK